MHIYMAKFDITFTCGHTDRVDIVGPMKDRQSKADWMSNLYCPACRESIRSEEKKAASDAAADLAVEQGLPDLKGSIKQVAYAVICRQEVLDMFRVAQDRVSEKINRVKFTEEELETAEDFLKKLSDVSSFIKETKTIASWWIDTRKELAGMYAMEGFVKRLIYEIERTTTENTTTTMKKKEIIVYRPEVPKTETLAVIRIAGDTVEVHFDERREDFRLFIKSLQFKWEAGRWARNLIKRNGKAIDRAAEVAHHLISKGFIVSSEEEVLQKAVLAEYEPEQTSWITLTREDHPDYPEWFYIVWDRKNDFYQAARRITGSKYLRPFVVVPPRYFELVQDFATTYGFMFTDAALRVAKSAAEEKQKEITVVVPTVNRPEHIQISGIPDQLEIPKVEIDEEFRDDN